jgi:hypothetical protein
MLMLKQNFLNKYFITINDEYKIIIPTNELYKKTCNIKVNEFKPI